MKEFSHPLTIVVPVFNAPDEVKRLVDSLDNTYPVPTKFLSFFFSDDVSTDKAMERVYAASFFSRADVRLVRRSENGGFIKNVNSVIRSLRREDREDDLVLMNSDTQVFHRVFERLQAAAYSADQVASVTPLTNEGTIASLYHFPKGCRTPSYFSPKAVSELVYERSIGPTLVPAPCGVGFCLYLRWEAILDTGLFDESFGRGYGEETDWCQRALNLGWTHQIHPHAYVEHQGAASFGKEEWLSTHQEKLRKINERYPEFDADLVEYFDKDPLKLYRITLVLEAFRRAQLAKGISLFALHSEPESLMPGGTEKFSRNLQSTLSQNGYAVLEMFPCGAKNLRLRGRFQEETFLQVDFHATLLRSVLELLRPHTRYLHVHHLLGWPDFAAKTLLETDFDSKIFTAHDFLFACPSYNLMTSNNEFCEVERDFEKCNQCFSKVGSYSTAPDIETYRQRAEAAFTEFDILHFPSRDSLTYWKKALAEKWDALSPKVRVQSHDLSELVSLSETVGPSLSPLKERHIVFLGALKFIKGRDLFLASVPKLLSLGFTVEALGSSPEPWNNTHGIQVTSYSGPRELKALLDQKRPGLIALPSLWAETYCYTFFESLLLADDAIPIVSPFGHPARMVEEHGAGVILSSLSPQALAEACQYALAQRETILPRKQAYSTLLKAPENYFATYREFWNTGRHRSFSEPSETQIAHWSSEHVSATSIEAERKKNYGKEWNQYESFLREAQQRRMAQLKRKPVTQRLSPTDAPH